MLPIFTKPIDTIVAADVHELVTRAWPESSQVEFKQALSTKSGKINTNSIPDQISEPSRDAILSELIAFANSQGGTLVLGIEETTDKPARAFKVTELPNVGELARSFEDQIRDCIDPKLSLFHVKAVHTNGNFGVIVFRVPASISAPHRIWTKNNQQAYVRYGLSTSKMTMRQIQDLTLDRARGFSGIRETFAQQSASFKQWLDGQKNLPLAAFSATAVPLSILPDPGRIYGLESLTEFYYAHDILIDNKVESCSLPVRGGRRRPILRGVSLFDDDAGGSYRYDVLQSGVINLWVGVVENKMFDGKTTLTLQHEHILAGIVSVLRALENFRIGVGFPNAEYGLLLEMKIEGTPQRTSYLGIEPGHMQAEHPMPNKEILFPIIHILENDGFNDLLSMIHTDVYDALSIQKYSRLKFNIQKSHKFQCL